MGWNVYFSTLFLFHKSLVAIIILYSQFAYVFVVLFCVRLFPFISFFFAQNSLLSACAWNFFIRNPFVYFNLMQHAPTARYIIKYFSILFSRSFYEFSTMQMAKFHKLEHSSAAPHILFYIVNFRFCRWYMKYIYTNTLIWLYILLLYNVC